MTPPRLLDVPRACAYLGGINDATMRRFVQAGVLVPVRLPSIKNPNEAGRRLLFDREDLDALIEKSKQSAPNAGLSKAALKGWSSTPVRKRGAA